MDKLIDVLTNIETWVQNMKLNYSIHLSKKSNENITNDISDGLVKIGNLISVLESDDSFSLENERSVINLKSELSDFLNSNSELQIRENFRKQRILNRIEDLASLYTNNLQNFTEEKDKLLRKMNSYIDEVQRWDLEKKEIIQSIENIRLEADNLQVQISDLDKMDRELKQLTKSYRQEINDFIQDYPLQLEYVENILDKISRALENASKIGENELQKQIQDLENKRNECENIITTYKNIQNKLEKIKIDLEAQNQKIQYESEVLKVWSKTNQKISDIILDSGSSLLSEKFLDDINYWAESCKEIDKRGSGLNPLFCVFLLKIDETVYSGSLPVL